MDELFKKCLKFVLQWEGGYVNHPNDKGGATNKGITQSTYNTWLKTQGKAACDVKQITDAEVEAIYYKNYWLAAGCDKMSAKFAALCFDTAVNMGTGIVKATGMTRCNEFLKKAEWKYPDKFIAARKAKYDEFIKYDPTQKVFEKGWKNRCNALAEFIKTL